MIEMIVCGLTVYMCIRQRFRFRSCTLISVCAVLKSRCSLKLKLGDYRNRRQSFQVSGLLPSPPLLRGSSNRPSLSCRPYCWTLTSRDRTDRCWSSCPAGARSRTFSRSSRPTPCFVSLLRLRYFILVWSMEREREREKLCRNRRVYVCHPFLNIGLIHCRRIKMVNC